MKVSVLLEKSLEVVTVDCRSKCDADKLRGLSVMQVFIDNEPVNQLPSRDLPEWLNEVLVPLLVFRKRGKR